ncbi:unnamed protein product, partial [Iphiclides podalirius]
MHLKFEGAVFECTDPIAMARHRDVPITRCVKIMSDLVNIICAPREVDAFGSGDLLTFGRFRERVGSRVAKRTGVGTINRRQDGRLGSPAWIGVRQERRDKGYGSAGRARRRAARRSSTRRLKAALTRATGASCRRHNKPLPAPPPPQRSPSYAKPPNLPFGVGRSRFPWDMCYFWLQFSSPAGKATYLIHVIN